MANRNKSYLNHPSSRQKRIIKTQNAEVTKFLHETQDVQPYIITRNRRNNIIIVDADFANEVFYAKILGTDENGNLGLLTIGALQYFDYHQGTFYVGQVDTVPNFRNLDTCTILLKAFENYAIELNYSKLLLDSLLNATKLEGDPPELDDNAPVEGIPTYTYPTGRDAQKYAGYFDKNLYIYYSNGFAFDKDYYDETDGKTIPLSKKKLTYNDLQYGINGKTYICKKTDPKFRMSDFHIKHLMNVRIKDYHSDEEREKTFKPITFNADKKSLADLTKFIEEYSN